MRGYTMFQRPAASILFTILFFWLPFQSSRQTADWRSRYRSPESERYIIRNGIAMTAFYSDDGRTCKVLVEASTPQPPASFQEVLKEVIPLSDRGKETRSLGLTSGLSGIASVDYELVHISLASTAEGTVKGATTGNVHSATVAWKGVQ